MKQHGFTLIELIITVAILAIITAIAIPAYNGYILTGNQATCKNVVAAIQLAEEEYRLQNNVYMDGDVPGTATTNLGTKTSNIFVPTTDATAGECTYSVTGSTPATYVVTATGKNGKIPSSWTYVFTK